MARQKTGRTITNGQDWIKKKRENERAAPLLPCFSPTRCSPVRCVNPPETADGARGGSQGSLHGSSLMRQRAGKRRGRVHEPGIRRNTRGSERQPPRVLQPCWWAIHFISMLAPRGSPFTSTTARAGLCPEKNFSYRALKSANREISVR